MNFIVSIILIISSIAVFFGYIDPTYKSNSEPSDLKEYKTYSVVALKQELANFQDIAQNSTNIVNKRNALITKQNSITTEDQLRLEKLLPSNIDNIRLIIEIGKIAEARNLLLKNVSVGNFNNNNKSAIVQDNSVYGTLSLSFTVTSTYNNFLSFLSGLENNLRIIDITDINFNSTDTGLYDFSVTLNTYWLK